MSWTDDRVETLRRLWKEGFSCSQIARQLGGVTRNAVIGKITRLGLAGQQGRRMTSATVGGGLSRGQRRSSVRKARKTRTSNGTSAFQRVSWRAFPVDPEPFIPPGEDLVIPENERKTIATLEPGDCRWPIGDPQHADFHFCGKNKVPGLPYCEFHARRAFQPPQPRRRADASRETSVEATSVREREKA